MGLWWQVLAIRLRFACSIRNMNEGRSFSSWLRMRGRRIDLSSIYLPFRPLVFYVSSFLLFLSIYPYIYTPCILHMHVLMIHVSCHLPWRGSNPLWPHHSFSHFEFSFHSITIPFWPSFVLEYFVSFYRIAHFLFPLWIPNPYIYIDTIHTYTILYRHMSLTSSNWHRVSEGKLCLSCSEGRLLGPKQV